MLAPPRNAIQLGKYQLIAQIGQGGMAEVYLALAAGPTGLGFEKLVVVKRLREHLSADPGFVTMLLDEARIAARLNHANVVQTLEVGEVDGSYFIAMEYLEGQSLQRVTQHARSGGWVIEPEFFIFIVTEVLSALDYAHNLTGYDGKPLDLVHRDVSPHNIFLTYDGRVKLVDFGIAKAVGRWHHTKTGVVKGKLKYMAPEQALGRTLDERADLFSVGVTLWEGLTQQRMWQKARDVDILKRITSREPLDLPSTVAPEVHPAFDEVCRRALAFDPDERYATAAAFRVDLEAAMETAGMRATGRDIGDVVSTMFAETRAEMRAIIERQIAKHGASKQMDIVMMPTSPTSTSAPISSTARSPGQFSSTRPLVSSVPVEETNDSTGYDDPTRLLTDSSSETPPPRRRRSRTTTLLYALVLVLVIVAAALRLRDNLMRSTPAEPTASAAPAASEMRDITLTIRATPDQARFVIDDGPALENPHVGKYPADGKTHQIRVEADGYSPRVKSVTFTNDLVLDVSLSRVAPTPSAKSERHR